MRKFGKNILTVVIWAAIAFGGLVLVVGCPAVNDTTIDQAPTSDSIAKAEANRVSALSDVNKAKPHSDRIGKAHLGSAADNLTTQGAALEKARRDNAANLKGWAKTVSERNQWRQHAQKLEGDFFSVRQRRYFWAIVGVTVGAWVVAGLLGVFLPGSIGLKILNFIPVAGPFLFFRNKRSGE